MIPDRDELREKVARALVHVTEDSGWRDWECCDEPRQAAFLRMADAVLAVFPQYEQCGWRKGKHFLLWRADHDSAYMLGRGWVPVYIVREDNTPKVCEVCGGRGWVLQPGSIQKGEPCPRGCKPEGESQ